MMRVLSSLISVLVGVALLAIFLFSPLFNGILPPSARTASVVVGAIFGVVVVFGAVAAAVWFVFGPDGQPETESTTTPR